MNQMKNKFLFSLFVLSFSFIATCVSAQTSITLKNNTSNDRNNEVVEVSLASDVYDALSSLALFDAEENSVPYQVLPYENKIIFQATVAKNSTAIYTLKEGVPVTVEAKTYAAIMKPDSRGDIAWENDRAAYRMYNKKLLASEPNSANGVDLWVKKVSEPIVETMYTYSDYHSEQPEGVDAYSVGGKTLGAGGVAAYVNNKLWLHNPFDECEIIANGPLRSEFILTYKKVMIDGDSYTKTVRITSDANGLLNKAVVKYDGKIKSMKIAAGIFLHTGTNGIQYTSKKNIIGYAENASEGKVYSPNARFYTGIYMPGETTLATVDNQRIIYRDYIVGTELTYYFGGGWNIFPEGEYSLDEDWFTALDRFENGEKNPLIDRDNITLPNKKEIIQTAITVNNRWIGNNATPGNNTWRFGVYNAANMDLYKVYPDPNFLTYSLKWAAINKWNIAGSGNNYIDADDHTAGQAYIELYLMDEEKDEAKISATKKAIDTRIAKNPSSDDWWWIDAMLMAMPTIAQLGVIYEDDKYFDKMYDLYYNIRNRTIVAPVATRAYLWPTEYQTKYGKGPILPAYDQYKGLFNEEDHLWWRDWGFKPNVPPKKVPGNSSADVPKESPDGKNIYWSRGNGWVLAAMVRVLDVLPKDEAHREEYLDMFKKMSAALIKCQREDGFWNMNLADDNHYPGPETSGTALFTYGLAWGINKGFLDKETYYPVVAKAWNGLCEKAILANGTVKYIQDVGEDPVSTSKLSDNVNFGIGAVLWAASEVVKLASGEMPEAPEAPIFSIKKITPQSQKILVEFDDEIDKTSALEVNNYEISEGIKITKVTSYNSKAVVLALEKTLPYGRYLLTVNNILNSSGSSIPANTNMKFIFTVPLSNIQPEISITAIGNQEGYPPQNVMDKDLREESRWSQQGEKGQWIKFDMGKDVLINAVDIAFFKGDQRVSYFDLDASSDNKTFTPVLSELTSSGETLNMERYSFEPIKARYIRIVCNSNSAGGEHWNSITEARVQYETLTGMDNIQLDSSEITIYPNPVTDGQFIIEFSEKSIKTVNVMIYDTAGNNLFQKEMKVLDGKINMDKIQLGAGTYIVMVDYNKEKINKLFFVK